MVVAVLLAVTMGCAGPERRPSSAASRADTARAEPRVVASPADSESAAAAIDVLRSYYAAIAARDFRRAYGLWEGDGAASGTSFTPFAAGFAHTASVTATFGTPGRIEGAAGSRYVEIPAEIRARTTDGAAQAFFGTYVLRRSVVDGATAAQRHWRLYSARIRPSG